MAKPLLDVSEVLIDPDFEDEFIVTRQASTVSAQGRNVLTPTLSKQFGVITMADGSVFDQYPDLVRSRGTILVHTKFRLTDGNGNTQYADQVTWPAVGTLPGPITGPVYQVYKVENYSRYGDGYICGICTLKSLAAGVT